MSTLIDGWTFLLLWSTTHMGCSLIRATTLLTSRTSTRLLTGETDPVTTTVAKLIGETAGLLFSMTNSKVKIFFIKSNGTGFKADSKIIRYFNFFSPVKN